MGIIFCGNDTCFGPQTTAERLEDSGLNGTPASRLQRRSPSPRSRGRRPKSQLDVSTCDEDAAIAYSARVVEWQPDDERGAIRLLCEYESDNFGMLAIPRLRSRSGMILSRMRSSSFKSC